MQCQRGYTLGLPVVPRHGRTRDTLATTFRDMRYYCGRSGDGMDCIRVAAARTPLHAMSARRRDKEPGQDVDGA